MKYELSGVFTLLLYIVIYTISACCLNLKNYSLVVGRHKIILKNYFIIIILPIIIAAIRYRVGSDYHSYFGTFFWIKDVDITTWFNYSSFIEFIDSTPIGLYFLSKLASMFGSYHVYFGLLALLIYLPIVHFLKNHWYKISLSLAAFIFLCTSFSAGYNIIKQTIAVSIVFWGLQFIYSRNFIKYLLTVLISCMFHVTAIVALPLYMLWNDKGNISTWKSLLGFTLCIIALFSMDTVTSFMGGHWESLAEIGGTSNKTFILVIIWLIVFVIFKDKLIKLDYRNKLLIFMYFIGVILYSVGFISIFGKRIANYFLISQFLLMTQLPECVKRHSKYIVKIALIMYTLILFIYTYWILGQSLIFPFRFAL